MDMSVTSIEQRDSVFAWLLQGYNRTLAFTTLRELGKVPFIVLLLLWSLACLILSLSTVKISAGFGRPLLQHFFVVDGVRTCSLTFPCFEDFLLRTCREATNGHSYRSS